MSDPKPLIENALLKKLAAGQTALCLTIRISRTLHAVAIARAAGFDALYVDMEHSSTSFEDASQMCLAACLAGVVPLVRVPSHEHYDINRALDGGAAGIIIPHVDTADEARACVAACKFPPVGKRSVAGSAAVIGYASVPAAEMSRVLNANIMVIPMLETPTAIANADEIAAVEGIDMLLIGTNDLMSEMGIPGKLDDPKVRAAYATVAAACKKHRRYLGIGGIKGGEILEDLRAMGAQFLLARADEAMLLDAAREETKMLRGIFN
jgi:2-keto-3-deoxy-L-rhamnonate aldolase RhmA